MKRFLLQAYFSEREGQAYHQINLRPITLKNHHIGVNAVGENLNSVLPITSRLAFHHRMQLAGIYVNGDPFNVERADWTLAVNEWLGYMQDPASIRVEWQPALHRNKCRRHARGKSIHHREHEGPQKNLLPNF